MRLSLIFPKFAAMQEPVFSLKPILAALGMDETHVPSIEKSKEYPTISQARTPNQLYDAIRIIGTLLNATEQAEQLVAPLEERTNIIEHKLKFIAADQRPSVLCLEDVSPSSIMQNDYLDALVRLAGGIPFTDTADSAFKPDVLIIISDQPVPALFGELPALLSSSTWEATPAVAKNNIFIIQDPQALRHPGLSVADDAEILAEIISTKYFFYGHDGEAWIRFELA